jgi:hypothetical protein
VPESAWVPALDGEGGPRDGAWVTELDVDLSAWPVGTRAICRRERPHPGAQLSFSDVDGHRFQVMLTNQRGSRIARRCGQSLASDPESGSGDRSVIPRAQVTAWRASAPWPLDEQVEQDLILSRALTAIFARPSLRQALAFRGGTALHKLHFDPPGRYSEDLDLV